MLLVAGVSEVRHRLAVLPVLCHLIWHQPLVADLTAGPLRDRR